MQSALELACGRRRVPLILRDDRLLTIRRIERTTFVVLMIAPKFAEMTHGAHLRRARVPVVFSERHSNIVEALYRLHSLLRGQIVKE